MSGGSYDYAHCKVDDFASNLTGCQKDPRRAAFRDLCRRVAKAMHDIEWVDSCDCSPGGEVAAIDAALGPNASAMILNAAIENAEPVMEALSEAIARARGAG